MNQNLIQYKINKEKLKIKMIELKLKVNQIIKKIFGKTLKKNVYLEIVELIV